MPVIPVDFGVYDDMDTRYLLLTILAVVIVVSGCANADQHEDKQNAQEDVEMQSIDYRQIPFTTITGYGPPG